MHRTPECNFCHCGAQAWAVTTQSRVVIVDRADASFLQQVAWQAFNTARLSPYAHSKKARRLFGSKSGYLHTMVLRLPDGKRVDHINGAGMDCRRINLRPSTQKQNTHNRRPMRGSTSKYRGVSWQSRKNKWVAQIDVGGKHYHIGYFASEDEAAAAYDVEAGRHFGEFARLNFQAAII